MKTAPNNPVTNKLGTGVTDEKIEEAVPKSGFPPQTRIAGLLSKEFDVREEWSYVDVDSKEERTIDILASKYYKIDNLTKTGSHVYPVLDLVIECKNTSYHMFSFCRIKSLGYQIFLFLQGCLRIQSP